MELENFDMKLASPKLKLNEFIDKLGNANKKALTYEKEANKLKQKKIRLDKRYRSEFPSFDEVKDRCKVAETEAKCATELADKTRGDAVTSQKEKSESLRLAIGRISQTEKAERPVEKLERQKINLEDELDRFRVCEWRLSPKLQS